MFKDWGEVIMRLSRRETIFLGAIVFIGLCILPLTQLLPTHSATFQRMIPVDDTRVSIAEPTRELYRLAENEGLTGMEWTVYWRGTLTTAEAEEWMQQLRKDSRFLSQTPSAQTRPTTNQNQVWQTRIWEKEETDTTHQLQIFHYPREMNKKPNYIYTWKGSSMQEDWAKEYNEMEEGLFNHLQNLPQKFSCLEAITGDKLIHDLSLKPWITHELKGKVTHRVSEPQFVSLNGYIPNWDQRSLSAGDQDVNIQISARYNALDEQTRVTLGYPLILNEH